MIKRLEQLDIATADLADAGGIYARNFGFTVTQAGDETIVTVGDAQIRLRAGASVAPAIAANGEGMIALWLEATDVAEVAAALARAGVAHQPVRREGERRVLEILPEAANMVPLFIFDRRT